MQADPYFPTVMHNSKCVILCQCVLRHALSQAWQVLSLATRCTGKHLRHREPNLSSAGDVIFR